MGEKLNPYPINLSVGKLQNFLDVCEPMDPDIFNMGVRILAPNALENPRANGKQLESTTWTWSSTYVINYFYYIYCLLLDRYFYLDPISKSP
jgi:hypothetical protein